MLKIIKKHKIEKQIKLVSRVETEKKYNHNINKNNGNKNNNKHEILDSAQFFMILKKKNE